MLVQKCVVPVVVVSVVAAALFVLTPVVAPVTMELVDAAVVVLVVVSHPLHVFSHLSPTPAHKP